MVLPVTVIASNRPTAEMLRCIPTPGCSCRAVREDLVDFFRATVAS